MKSYHYVKYDSEQEENVYFKVTDSLDISEKINISENKYTLKRD